MGKRASIGGGADRLAKVKVVDRQTILSQISAKEAEIAAAKDEVKNEQMIQTILSQISAKKAEIAAAKDEVKNEQRINTALRVGLTQSLYQWNYEPQRAPVTLLK